MEGSVTDAEVYKKTRDFKIPKGKYYFADAGYPLSDGLLVPYSGVRRHPHEWASDIPWYFFLSFSFKFVHL